MSSFGNQATGHESLVTQVFHELDDEVKYVGNAEDVIMMGRNSKTLDAFNFQLIKMRISFSVSRVRSIFNAIHRVYPPKSESEPESSNAQKEEIKIEVVEDDPEFLSKMKHRYFSEMADEVSSQEQDTEFNHAAKNHRALIDRHRSTLGEIKPQRALIPPRETPAEKERESFPVFAVKDDIVQALKDCETYRTLIVVGKAGSGKTSQIPQYLVEADFVPSGCRIVCTQPRRDAAKFAGQRVPDEKIKYMDEFALCCNIITGNKLSSYSAFVIDDAHERSVTTDLLLGLIKNVVFEERTDICLIVTLAYPDDAQRLHKYFFNCKIITVPYLPCEDHRVEIIPLENPIPDPLEKGLQLVLECRIDQPHGDILLFLSCQDEVDYAIQRLSDSAKTLNPAIPQLIVVSACSSLRAEIDPKVFEETPLGAVKVVVATIAAETSLALLDTVRYVIDLGLTERRVIDTRQVIGALAIMPISNASADRRTKLARHKGGKCFQLYTGTAYCCQMSSAVEIQTANLGATAVRILLTNDSNITNFEFVDPPPRPHMASAMRQLYCLEAVDERGNLTPLGSNMILFPLDPPWSKVLFQQGSFRCNRRATIVVAMAQVGSTFFRPGWENQPEADRKHGEFFRSEGDHMSWLAVYEAWEDKMFSSKWCDDNFVDFESLTKARDIRNQLLTVSRTEWSEINIPKAITSGLFFHAAKKDLQEGGYRTLVGNSLVYTHPQSVLFRRQVQPEWVIYNKLVQADQRECMFGVMAIDPNWLIELAPRFFRARELLH